VQWANKLERALYGGNRIISAEVGFSGREKLMYRAHRPP
jgi:hypothetical protein